ncbi:hypothetical protein UFOVP49_93 [uncultured Caudovirales phage]|uniref:NTP pyrophosphohydrolase MazG putative catalytic core domain-containing protein n=1 Tax=uncultured Caudovirales phage TaxID=2100421 RepID=A0A6J5KT24_9CAUD|nr:hypothetical protein UFOVP49_93 [uncultured Caudovirales phage]
MKNQKELLSILQEECNAASQVILDIFKYGLDAHHPKDKNKKNNLDRLYSEVGAILATINSLVETDNLEANKIFKAAEVTIKDLKKPTKPAKKRVKRTNK